MTFPNHLLEMLIDDEFESVLQESDWNSVRKYIAADYKSRSEETLREMYEERFKPAYVLLVNELIAGGYVISVWDGEEWATRRSASKVEILEAIEAVEEAELHVFEPDTRAGKGKRIGWAQVSPYGLAPDEIVIDHTVGLEQYAPSLGTEDSV